MLYVAHRPTPRFVLHSPISRLSFVVLLGLLLTGCEVLGSADDTGSHLDEQLRTRIVEASDGSGLSFFVLPESDDFNIDSSMVYENATYKQLFAEAFPDVPKGERMTAENAGLAIAAYERTLMANGAPFQRWLRGDLGAMDEAQKYGALLFFGKAQCVECHTGPALNSMTFFALGMRDLESAGIHGDFAPEEFEATRRGRGGFTKRADDMYAFKTPQLYNLTDSPFYGHGAEFSTLREVVEYKNAASPSNPLVPADHLADAFRPLSLTQQEVADLTAFLEGALYDADLMRYAPDALPTGNCFPVSDAVAQADLGC